MTDINDSINTQYGNPYFTVNASDNSNAFIAFSTNNKINLRLVNNIQDIPNEFIIASEYESFQLKSGSNPFYKYESNLNTYNGNVMIDGILDTHTIKHIGDLKMESMSYSFLRNNTNMFNINNTVNVNTDLNITGKLNIKDSNLPNNIVLLDKNKKIPSTLLPSSTSSGKLIYGSGTKFGVGTTLPSSKFHVYDGDALIESGFIAINELYDQSMPLAPIHIRTQGNRVGTPQILLDNAQKLTKIILMSDYPFIGIGTSIPFNDANVSLYVDKNILSRGSISIKNINIDDNLFIDSSNLVAYQKHDFNIVNTNLLLNDGADITFNGYSTCNVVLDFYGKVNSIFGDTANVDGYRLNVNSETSNVLAIGTNIAEQVALSFYKNNYKINMLYKGTDKLYIDNNLIITNDVLGDLAYLDNINFTTIQNNPLEVVNNPNSTYIKDIASENKYTIILLNDNTLYYIKGTQKLTRLFTWFNLLANEIIENVKIENGMVMYFTNQKNLYFNLYAKNNVNGRIINVVNASYDDVKILYYNQNLQLFWFIVSSKQTVTLNIPFIITNIGYVNQYDNLFFIYYSGLDIYDERLSKITNNSSNFNYVFYHSYINSTVNITITRTSNKLLIINESFKKYTYSNTDVVHVNASKDVAIFITSDGSAYYFRKVFNEYNVEQIKLSTFLFNDIRPKFVKGFAYDEFVILYDTTYTTLFTKSNTFEGLGRGATSSFGSFPPTDLAPLTIPFQNNNLISQNNLLIGSVLRYVNNMPTNSVLIDNSLGIRVPPNDLYPLSINGNLNIIGGDILINGIPLNFNPDASTDSSTVSAGFINVLNFDSFFNEALEKYRITPTGFYNKSETDILYITNDDSLSNIAEALQPYITYEEYSNTQIWNSIPQEEYKIIATDNSSVLINATTPQIAPNQTIPALYVANKGNLKGILCDDNIAAYSDIRIKNNLEKITSALDKIESLNGYYYNKIDDPNKRHVGLIAQEVENVLPEVVSEYNGLKTIAYGNIIALLIEGLKELAKKID